MGIIQESFYLLYPLRDFSRYSFSIKYSGKFTSFNANVKMLGKDIEFSLSKDWKGVDKEIVMGLIQELMNKLFKTKIETKNIKLYHIFTKKVHIAAEKSPPDPHLLESFHRVNERFFYGMLDQPNLRFGKAAMRTMGSYNYQTDAITMSSLLREADDELLDYVMYHELLHKRMKFESKGGKTIHHSKEFKRREKIFPNSELMEKRLGNLGNKSKGFLGLFR